MSSFLTSLSSVLEHGLNTNSYKFALARVLAEEDLPRAHTVEATWLAEKFLGLYWPLATQFRVRQSTDPKREPVAHKWAAELAVELDVLPGRTLSAVRAGNGQRVQQLVARLAGRGGCLDEVVPRFNYVRGAEVPNPLFRPAADGRSLSLTPGAVEWIAEHRLAVRQLSTGAWVRFTEMFSAAPRLYQKLAGEVPLRRSLSGHRATLQASGTRCFYCGRDDALTYEVDHFLPWSFVLEDRVWNLVLACGGQGACNQRKRDAIPDERQLDRLMARNQTFLEQARKSPGTCHVHMKEWLDQNLANHLRQLRAAALAEGFPSWSGP